MQVVAVIERHICRSPFLDNLIAYREGMREEVFLYLVVDSGVNIIHITESCLVCKPQLTAR